MSAVVLVVDDEQSIVDILRSNLEREGYQVLVAMNGFDAVDIALNKAPDLMLLDYMLPGLDGLSVCKRVREKSNMPILMLTAKGEEIDKVLGLEFGADDYITKPFSLREVLARVRAHLRRLTATGQNTSQREIYIFGDIEIDATEISVKVKDKLINLTLREYELLLFLAKNAGMVYTREDLLEKVWGYDYFGDLRTVDVTIRRIREKLEPDVENNTYNYVLTKWGRGYYFNKGANQ